MKIFFNYQRPSALPAACAQVPGSLASAEAHPIPVGPPAVWGEPIIQARYHQVQQVRGRIVAKSDALTVQGSVMVAARDLGDVRGVPPRGRPV